MIIKFLLLFVNVLIIYSYPLYHVYSGFDLQYLYLEQKFSLIDEISFSEGYANIVNNKDFIRFQFDDDFPYKNIQEHKDLNIEKTISSNWGKKIFRFSAISVGTFPVAFFISLFCFDFFVPLSNNVMVLKDRNFNRFAISTSIGLALSFIVALIDSLI
ncbi:hypothetical protein [Borrelia sp. HM]|uniref:hypothetical protein n=1 Tax=Borrelia sp. HM TaxID=1882662 RepID=UPI001C7458C8|nr:hypothetical protein [Borrelia sp. HM]BCR21467.1 hypothetical protein BKFM_00027 [Borrelia sp. HM]